MHICSGSISLLNLTFINSLTCGSDGHESTGGSTGMGGVLFVSGEDTYLENIKFVSNIPMRE